MAMRIWCFLSFLLVILFTLHGLLSADMLITIGYIPYNKMIAQVFGILVLVHGVFGILFSIDSIKAGLQTKRWYFKQNARFWIKRISGVLILLFFALHMGRYTGTAPDGSFMLVPYDIISLLLQLGLIASVAAHLAVSIKPGLIRSGIESFKPVSRIALVIACSACVVMAFSAFKYLAAWMGGAL